jgi:hypothetical protein
MTEGGVALPSGRGFTNTAQWMPPGENGERWDSARAVALSGFLPKDGEPQSLGDILFGFSPDAVGWYCDTCQKAVAVFQKDVPYDPFPGVPNGPLPPVSELMKRGAKAPPETPSEPEPAPAPRKDPWEKGGLFRRKKKKPDWEL